MTQVAWSTDTPNTDRFVTAADRLRGYLLSRHWNGAVLRGPDPGVRWNFRLGRFVKSYLRALPWSDDYVFQQAQGYWILGNWAMAELCDSDSAREVALACSAAVRDSQAEQGCWIYPPLPTRVGKIATVEGNYATIGLLETYKHTRSEAYLAPALRWYDFLVRDIGFLRVRRMLAIHYWARSDAEVMVPNNSASTLYTLACIYEATGDRRYLEHCEGLVGFLRWSQTRHGELPYVIGQDGVAERPHFLCYQYNAFALMALSEYHRLTGDEAILPVLEGLGRFLVGGVQNNGAARFDCQHPGPEVTYYSAALAAALGRAAHADLVPDEAQLLAETSARAYDRVLSLQGHDGSMDFFSKGDYGVLGDRRSYPRYLAMILHHLMVEVRHRHEHARVEV